VIINSSKKSSGIRGFFFGSRLCGKLEYSQVAPVTGQVAADAPDTLPRLPEPEKPFQPAPFMLVFIPLQAQQAVMPALQNRWNL